LHNDISEYNNGIIETQEKCWLFCVGSGIMNKISKGGHGGWDGWRPPVWRNVRWKGGHHL